MKERDNKYARASPNDWRSATAHEQKPMSGRVIEESKESDRVARRARSFQQDRCRSHARQERIQASSMPRRDSILVGKAK